MQEVDDRRVCESPSDAELQRELLQRVANSKLFSSCHGLRAFLLYVGEQAIAGRLDAIKEQQIGSRVFGRKPDYDPGEDNIVRVRARELRQRLGDYFEGEGRDETLVVSIPKGHYIPVFQPRSVDQSRESISFSPKAALHTADRLATPAEIAPPDTVAVHSLVVQTGPRWPRGVTLRRSYIIGLVILLTAVGIVVGALFWSKQNRKHFQDQVPPDETRSLWEQLFPAGGQELTVVCADAGFALWQDITGHNLNLGDYLSRRWYTENEAGGLKLREIAIRRFSSPADLSVAVRIAEIARSYNSHIRVRFARNVDIHEVRSGNLVLLGSRRSNPWLELFESRLNFVLEFNPNRSGPAFRNRSPKPGEPITVFLDSSLSVQGPESKLIKSYAVAAMLPGPTDHSNVLIVEGLSMEGTEAAGEFVTNPKRFNALLRRIGQKGDKPIKPFEVLLRLTAVAGGYADPEIVAYRYPVQ